MSLHPSRRRHPFSRASKSTKKSRRNRKRDAALGRVHYGLTLERLEDRLVLSGTPVLLEPSAPSSYLEGQNTGPINFEFTDTLSGGGGSVGISPAGYTLQGILNPLQPNVLINTDTFQLIDMGANLDSTSDDTVLQTFMAQTKSVSAQTGFSAYQIAVLPFTSIDIPLGVTLRAIGSRPLALLSTTAITVAGTIDVSAYYDPNTAWPDTPAAQQRLAGAGGGHGGYNVFDNGSPAAGAPASPNTVGQNPFPLFDFPAPLRGAGGGGYGGLGGPGFRGDLSPPVRVNLGGAPFGDLAIGIQGGSGGGAAWENFTSSFYPMDGGGGGGGIEIGAATTITVTGSILAAGGNGVSFALGAAGGGGGAGGGILLHAPAVTVSGTLSATGGDSRGNDMSLGIGGGGAGGRIGLAATTVLTAGATITVAGGFGFPTGQPNGDIGSDGDPGNINLNLQPAGAPDTYTVIIDWNDGTLPQDVSGSVTYTSGGDGVIGSFTASHLFIDESAGVEIIVTAQTAGTTTSLDPQITADNVAPTLTISGNSTVNEGALYTLTLSESDPGADTITSWTINWGDSIEVVSGNPSSAAHTYADGDNNYTISAEATDEDGTWAAAMTVAVLVANVAPTLSISGSSDTDEGDLYTLNLSASGDPGQDTIASWTINWGDGDIENFSGNPSSASHAYADGDANYTISASATDEDGTYVAGNTVAVTVHNVDPTADAGGPYLALDEMPVVLTASATDPAGAADPLTFQWDLDDDGIFGETGAGATRGNEVGATVTMNTAGLSGVVTVDLRVTDGDGGVGTDTAQVITSGVHLIDGTLWVVGTNGYDLALITRCGDQIYVYASFNDDNPAVYDSDDVQDIQVRLRGGHDILITTSNVTQSMTIDGGSGNDLLTGGGGRDVITGGAGHDTLWGDGGDDVLLGGTGNDDLFGGSGNDVLVGGDGNDILSGGSGRDLLIGSQDNDDIEGGDGEDILIGGYTIHDNNVAALDAVMAIWTSSASFNARVATLTSTGGLLQAGVTVFDDNDCDDLNGNAGRDLYFGDTSKSGDGVKDNIDWQSAQDKLIALN